MAMPYDAERVMQLRSMLHVRGVESETGEGPATITIILRRIKDHFVYRARY
jgi:hypothetical protein